VDYSPSWVLLPFTAQCVAVAPINWLASDAQLLQLLVHLAIMPSELTAPAHSWLATCLARCRIHFSWLLLLLCLLPLLPFWLAPCCHCSFCLICHCSFWLACCHCMFLFAWLTATTPFVWLAAIVPSCLACCHCFCCLACCHCSICLACCQFRFFLTHLYSPLQSQPGSAHWLCQSFLSLLLISHLTCCCYHQCLLSTPLETVTDP